MPKPYTFPTLYNQSLQIHISKIKEWGYLKAGRIINSTYCWSSNGNPTGSISIQVNTHSQQPYIELDYKYKDEPRNYKVYLTSIPSNLNKGEVWYFICPHTKKHCRKLYSIGGYFLHREAFKGCMYSSQTYGKAYRGIDSLIGIAFQVDDLYLQLHKKHFKRYYAGKPTKKYLRLMEQIQRGESIPYHGIEQII